MTTKNEKELVKDVAEIINHLAKGGFVNGMDKELSKALTTYRDSIKQEVLEVIDIWFIDNFVLTKDYRISEFMKNELKEKIKMI